VRSKEPLGSADAVGDLDVEFGKTRLHAIPDYSPGLIHRRYGFVKPVRERIRDALRGRPELPYHIDWNERITSGLNGLTWMGS
jgi:hypothetical protein